MELWSLATLELIDIEGEISNLTLEVLKKNKTTPMIKVDNNESVARFTAHSGSNNNTSNFQTNLFGNGRYLKFSFTYQTA